MFNTILNLFYFRPKIYLFKRDRESGSIPFFPPLGSGLIQFYEGKSKVFDNYLSFIIQSVFLGLSITDTWLNYRLNFNDSDIGISWYIFYQPIKRYVIYNLLLIPFHKFYEHIRYNGESQYGGLELKPSRPIKSYLVLLISGLVGIFVFIFVLPWVLLDSILFLFLLWLITLF
jgi:hypothetical protein